MKNSNNENKIIGDLRKTFIEKFARTPNIFKSPGRVNIIGEHTDYNDGFVLPVAIDRYTWLAIAPRKDQIVNAIAMDIDESLFSFSLDQDIVPHEDTHWSDYLKGVVKELIKQGNTLQGFDMVVTGNVPQGAGLSSSASFEMAIVAALSSLFQLGIDGKSAALMGQAAENNFVGCKCGIMDQLISACGRGGQAMLLDCRSLETQFVSIPDSCELVIVNSNVKRGLVESEYNTRREQCEQAAAFFGVKALRDLDLETLESSQKELDPVIFKRAKHIVTENQRTLLAAEALASGDLEKMGPLMAASHTSMRDDFAITVPAIDKLVAIMKEVIGSQGGVRMTGGGFGGCVVALVPKSMTGRLVKAVEKSYPEATGLQASVYLCSTSDGGLTAS